MGPGYRGQASYRLGRLVVASRGGEEKDEKLWGEVVFVGLARAEDFSGPIKAA
jgi:hypothetical protein